MKKNFLYLFFVLGLGLKAQKTDSLKINQILSELKTIQYKVFYSKSESERFSANKDFIKAIEALANNKSALSFPFDSLRDISTITSKDKSFKLLTWNIPKDNETHFYFGFLMVENKKRIKKGFMKHDEVLSYDYYKLVDVSTSARSPENHIGTPAKWFGMLYYEMIECDGYYTLLGWDGNDKLVQRKFIDVLYFKSNGTPIFGKDVFKFPRKNPKRIMFEYSSEVTMSLKHYGKGNKIVYSHLSPREEGGLMEGLYQYYGPDGSFDSMIQRKGKWVIEEDVDARNIKNKNDNREKPNPDNQKPMFTPK